MINAIVHNDWTKEDLRPIATDKELTLEQIEVIRFVQEKQKITRREAVALLEFGETKIKEVLNSLLDEQVLVRRGQGRSTYYEFGSRPTKNTDA